MKPCLLSSFSGNRTEAGCDEAGRGCLAGPVVAAAVILPRTFRHPLLNDSKQLSHSQRNTLRPIIEAEALSWAIGVIEPEVIDEINILRASFKAMHVALQQLSVKPELILVDGNRFDPYPQVPHHCIIKGDGKYMSIAAASVLAKTHRDEIMEKLHIDFPQYHWAKNKGYPTPEHRMAILETGSSPHHRKSFTLLPEQLRLAL
ncbi:MAG: ribonuclease HII [Flavobacteriales bacterium]|jgi:ribonuclease HII